MIYPIVKAEIVEVIQYAIPCPNEIPNALPNEINSVNSNDLNLPLSIQINNEQIYSGQINAGEINTEQNHTRNINRRQRNQTTNVSVCRMIFIVTTSFIIASIIIHNII